MGWHPSLFDPQGAFLLMCSQEGLLDLEDQKSVVSLSFIWAEFSSSLPLSLLLSSSIHWGQSPAIYPFPVVAVISFFSDSDFTLISVSKVFLSFICLAVSRLSSVTWILRGGVKD